MKIAIFAAGTGGHIYPALSIAEKFGKENVIFIASNREIERKIFIYSIFYLFFIFLILLIDNFLKII